MHAQVEIMLALLIAWPAVASTLPATHCAPLVLRGGGVKIVSTWAGDVRDVAAGAAVGVTAGFVVGTRVKSSINFAELVHTQAAILVMLSRLGLIQVEWARVRNLVARAAGLPIRSMRLLVAQHADEKRRHKEAELERTSRAAHEAADAFSEDSAGPDAAWHPFNEHAAVGSLCAFAAGVSLSSGAGVGADWRRIRGGAYLPAPSRAVRSPCGGTATMRRMRGSARTSCAVTAAVTADADEEAEEEDWVRARIEAEDRAFGARREEASAARAAAWEEEARALRANEALWTNEDGGGAPEAAAAAVGDSPLAFQHQQPSTSSAEHDVAEYEARLRAASRPKTEAEKREARHRDMLTQIEQADAMDERLRERQRTARREAGFEE